jgi:adenylate cyclase
VHDEVASLLRQAEQAAALQQMAVRSGHMPLSDEAAWRAHLMQTADVFDDLSYFTIADADGHFIGLQVAGQRRWARTEADRYDVFALTDDGDLGPKVSEASDYDIWEREWYAVPARTLQRRWSDIYVWASPPLLSMTLSDPLVDDEGGFAGIVAIDLALADIHRFLRTLDVGPGGRVFLLQPDGQLVAASAAPDPFETGPDGTPRRLAASAYPDPVVAQVSEALAGRRSEASTLRLPTSEGTVRVRVGPLEAEGIDWVLVVVLSEADVLGQVWASARQTALWGLSFVVLAVGVGLLVARRVSEPLATLSREVQLVREFKLDNRFAVDTRLAEIADLKESLTTMQTGLSSFQRFVPADLVRRILHMGEEATLGSEARDVTVLFSDLRGYSTLIESLPPERVIAFMNAYFEAMEEVIDAHGGVVLELLGDAILAVFGAPDALPGHAEKAASCAVAMRDRLSRLNADLPVELGHRIGVHTGEVVAGNIGGHSYMKYGVIGDVVNVTARLEQLNKPLGTSVLVSAEVLAAAPGLADRARDLGEVQLKGRDEPQRVFRL